MLKTALLVDYGQIASWADNVDLDVLLDCKCCFQKRKSALINDRHRRSNLVQCRYL